MCRGLAYLGDPILLDDLLFKSDSSLVKQSYLPLKMSHMLNLAGFGMSFWQDHLKNPTVYKSKDLPFYDKNLKNIAENFYSNCLIAHIRGVSFSQRNIISEQNAHPFIYPSAKVALAHNGALSNYESMKMDLFQYVKPQVLKQISGTTDSEIIYAILISQLEDPYENPSLEQLIDATMKTLKIIKKIRKKFNETFPSAVNLFLSNGDYLMITRYEFNYGSHLKSVRGTPYVYHSLFFTYGEKYGFFDGEYRMSGEKKKAIIFSSEPLTHDTTTWMEMQEYSIMTAQRRNEEIEILTEDIDL